MLNGNKSYLISFTALFSKKGYGLAFGIDTLLDVSRDTQYHLSAPAYSTYSALKMEVMKNATKLPYATSSLFGNGLKETSIATEYEGVEVESVFASVATYLSDIQQYLEGENKVDAQGSESTLTTETVRVGDGTEDEVFARNLGGFGGRILNAVDTLPDYAELLMYGANDPAYETGEMKDSSSLISEDAWMLNLTLDNYVAVEEEHSDGKLILPVFDASVEEQAEVENFSYIHQTEERLIVVSPMTMIDMHAIKKMTPFDFSHEHETLVEDFTDTVNLSFDKDAAIESFTSAVSGDGREAERPDVMVAGEAESGDYLHIQSGTEALASTGGDIDVEHFTEGAAYSTDPLYIEHATPADVSSRTEGSQSEHFIEGGNEVNRNTELTKTMLAENLKSIVSDSPEISSAGRLLEIMYGHRAAEMIQAGLERLVESHVDETMTADAGSITDAVIADLERALNAGSMEGVGSDTKTGTVEYFGDAVNEAPEHATSVSFGEGVYDFGAEAERNIGHEAVVHDIGKAIAEANLNLTMHRTETAFSENHTDVVLTETTEVVSTIVPNSDAPNETEVAAYVQNYEVLITPSERGRHLRDFDAVIQDPDLAEVVETAEGTLHEDVHARGGIRIYDAVDDTPDRGSKSNIVVEAITDYHSVASTDEITLESVVYGDERGENTSSMDGISPEKVEWADNVTIGDGVMDKEIAQGSADNTLNADIVDLVGLSGDNIYDAVNYEGVSAYIGDRSLVVDNQEQIQAQLDGGVVETVVDIDSTADLLAVTEEGYVDEVTDAIRKKKVIQTDIETAEEGRRKKEAIETTIQGAEQGGRVKEVISLSIDEGEEAKRPTKVIETVIEKSEGGTAITHPERKKPRIWLILGKIASWNIWNWKKTR
ncbi:hypothetical protein [Paenibacillus sp. 276b]|uniref:hypothetical protein n=1 Tax=Paenibacillus sp. 276b TaxID=1566277 RepID=UPI00089BD30A|nr:hypothetical protein [Paenibacillus sp. 276b]SEA79873.1 hypothetical protein SAMN03159332_2599 [Paenibacillus sp. 276b]